MTGTELTEVLFYLAAIGFAVAIVLLTFLTAYFVLAQRLTRVLQSSVERIERTLKNQRDFESGLEPTGIPPMRIHLEFAPDNQRAFGVLADSLSRWCGAQGFQFLGQFVIEEMHDEMLRTFVHSDKPVMMVWRLPCDVRLPYVEFSLLLDGDELAGVSNPPPSTVSLPDGAVGKFYFEEFTQDLRLLDQMWADVQQVLEEHYCVPVPRDPTSFACLYESAHATEMDLRLRAGGVTEQEICESFRQQGHVASRIEVERIQQQWQHAIELHLLDFSARASNHFYAGRSVLIVYEGSQQSYLATRMLQVLSSAWDENRQDHHSLIQNFTELHRLLQRFSPREAIARFRALLPKEMRYDLVDQLSVPIEADCYVLPAASQHSR